MVGNEGKGKWLGPARRKRRRGRKKKEMQGTERDKGETGELPALICPSILRSFTMSVKSKAEAMTSS